jgi:hypothetical protein
MLGVLCESSAIWAALATKTASGAPKIALHSVTSSPSGLPCRHQEHLDALIKPLQELPPIAQRRFRVLLNRVFKEMKLNRGGHMASVRQADRSATRHHVGLFCRVSAIDQRIDVQPCTVRLHYRLWPSVGD